MKIVEINTVCDTGSTGRIAAHIARISNEKGYEAYFAYGRGKHPNDIAGYKIGNKIDFIDHVLLNFFKGKSGFGSLSVTKKFLSWLDEVSPDIIHLHNIHGFYINIQLLFEYIKTHSIPVVWTLHDCWPFTGQCAYFDFSGCERWKEGCHDCPVYRTDYPYSLFCDNSKENYLEKKRVFSGVKNLVIVTPSNWLSNLVKDSFLKEYPTLVINNGIDTGVFRRLEIDQEKKRDLLIKHIGSRDAYDIQNKKIVLGVANIWSSRKGIDSFYRLAEILSEEYVIVLIGVSNKVRRICKKRYSGRIIGIGHTDSVGELAEWYNIANVYVNPTLEDNYPTTNIEALACGTPVITYDVGGSSETIIAGHGRTVKKGDVEELAKEIEDVIGRNETFEYENIYLDASVRLSQYTDLFNKLVNK